MLLFRDGGSIYIERKSFSCPALFCPNTVQHRRLGWFPADFFDEEHAQKISSKNSTENRPKQRCSDGIRTGRCWTYIYKVCNTLELPIIHQQKVKVKKLYIYGQRKGN
ncbi:unnamed protein product [Cuscuta europaea]|uniref:Uncharacterized protein n=1 Tax=Cuscuta europaea TaxID=41803 RepID=A0A9P0ZUR2_CUSEU|nr:unnamed protein product [Cuscuta europaea]